MRRHFAEVIRLLEARRQAALIAGTILRAKELADLVKSLRRELELVDTGRTG